MGHCRIRVDQGVERLIVVGCGEIKGVADGLFLGAGVLPPLPFQLKHLRSAGVEPIRGCRRVIRWNVSMLDYFNHNAPFPYNLFAQP